MLKRILQEVKNSFSNNKIFIYGESLRNIILNKEVDIYEFYIDCRSYDREETKNKAYSYISTLDNFPKDKIRFTLSKGGIDFSNTYYAMDCIWCDIDTLLNGSIKIDYKYRAIDDIKKNIIRINPKIEDNIIGVDFVFDCIKCASSTEFSLDMATVTKIFSLHKQLLNISKQRLNYYIRYIFSNGGKPRKTVALLNTLGISKLLFGCNLLETTTINHLKKEDTLELLSIIFSTVNDPKTTFQQLCFSEEDITYMLTVMDILNSITFDTDSLDTNLLFKTIKNEKIKVIERILTTFGLHNLRKKIKEKRNTDIMIEKLAITEDDIKLCFRNADVEKMLKTALEKVKNDPRLNSKPTLLLLLNKER